MTRLVTTRTKFWGWAIFVFLFGLLLGYIIGARAFVAREAEATFNPNVTICHATGSESNPFNQQTVNWTAVDGNGNGDHNRSGHQNGEDIIPPGFWDFNGRNWDTEGQAIWNNECEIPEPEPELCEDESALNYGKELPCEYEEEPPVVEEPRPITEALAPQCPNNRPVLGLANPHVIRNGSEATVNTFVLEGDRVNILFRTSGQSEWQHALRDVPVTNGYMSVTIHDLVPTGDYDFGIQNSNGCAGGEIVAVIVDGWQPMTFGFTRYERL